MSVKLSISFSHFYEDSLYGSRKYEEQLSIDVFWSEVEEDMVEPSYRDGIAGKVVGRKNIGLNIFGLGIMETTLESFLNRLARELAKLS